MRILLRSASLLALAATALSAQAVLIDFESVDVGATLSDQFAGQGVTFASGTGGLDVPNPVSTSPVFATKTDLTITTVEAANSVGLTGPLGAPLSGNVLGSFEGWLAEDGDPVFRLLFSTAISSISLDFGSNEFTFGGAGLFAYNAAGTLVATKTTVDSGGVNQTVSLSGLVGVVTVAVVPGGYNDYIAVDNLNFQPVPEPSALAALALPVLGLLKRRKRA